MFNPVAAAITAALILGLTPTLADAGQGRRHAAQHKTYRGHVARSHAPRSRAAPSYAYGSAYGPTSANPYPPSAVDDPYSPYAAPGAAIRAQARINQAAPGVTNEIAPDNIATATGGPSGGVPGFSSH